MGLPIASGMLSLAVISSPRSARPVRVSIRSLELPSRTEGCRRRNPSAGTAAVPAEGIHIHILDYTGPMARRNDQGSTASKHLRPGAPGTQTIQRASLLMRLARARRPRGAGAGGMALLMPLPEQTVEEILRANAARFGSYNNLSVLLVRKALSRSRALGYALNDIHNTTGATTLGLPIVNRYGDPFAAISIGAISSRMTGARQQGLVSILRKEVRVIETARSDWPRRGRRGGGPGPSAVCIGRSPALEHGSGS